MGTYSIGEVIQRRLKLERSVQARGEALYHHRILIVFIFRYSSRCMPPELANPNQHPSPFEDKRDKSMFKI